MKSKLILIPVIIALLIFPVGSAVASGSTLIYSDPGAVSLQDALIPQTLRFTVPPSTAAAPSVCNVNLNASSANKYLLSGKAGEYGALKFSGLYAALTNPASSPRIAFVSTTPLRATTGLPPASPQCESYFTLGEITLVATKDAPSNPVVVNQDPNRTGVDLTWTVNILPTVYTYGVWQIIPYPNHGDCKSLNAECLVNQSDKPCCTGLYCEPNNPNSGNGTCSVDPNYPPLWDCVDSSLEFREDIVAITAKAVLTESSRNWILNDLSRAYPGTTLQHPEWSFLNTKTCKWDHDICIWTHTEGHVPIVDPGWYDLLITGTTEGTDYTPPRVFTVINGTFGVWLVESTKTG